MTAPDRRRDKRSGKFSSSYDDLGLFDLVAAVARHANPAAPEKVSQPKWDAARAPAGYPDAPTARAIYGRLKMPWPEILATALSDSRNVEQTLSAVRRVDKRKLTAEEVFYGLARVARELDRRSFSFYEYLRTRSELVAADRRRNGEEAVLDQVMPTAEQILNEYEDDWNTALTAHGFDPFTQPPGKRAMTIQEAFDLLVELTGKVPQRPSFDEFRARYGVSIEKFAAGTTWVELEPQLRAKRAARGLGTPTVKLELADWDTIEIPDVALDGVERRIVKGHWTYERILLALTDYLALPGITPSQRDYLSRRKQHGWPVLRAIQRFGSWNEMLDRAREMLRTGEIPPVE